MPMRRTNVEYSSKCRAECCTATFAKRVLYDAFYYFIIFFEIVCIFKIMLYFCKRNQNLKTMEKVFMSVSFGKFKRTRFTEMSEAIAFVRGNKLSNTRLKLTKVSSIEEWDNF